MSDTVKRSGAEIAKRSVKIVFTVVLYLFVALCVLSVVLLLLGKGERDGATTVFGYQLRTVLTPSMDKNENTDVSGYDIGSIPKDAMVFIDTVPEDASEAKEWYSEIKVGDVLTFMYDEYDIGGSPNVITHRVIKITETEDGYTFMLRGDNDSSAVQNVSTKYDPQDPFTYVIGKVVGTNNLFGYFVTFIKKPVGMVFTVILPCVAIIIYEISRIFRVLGEKKREAIGAERALQAEKIAELERKLEEMKKKNGE